MAIPVKGYEDYIVYPNGAVYSKKSNKFLQHSVSNAGYHTVQLFNNGKSKRFLVHRLVAMAYIPNQRKYPQVNHIDEDPSNNNVTNLEWCTAKYNMNYGNGAKTRHAKIDYSKPIFKEIARRNGRSVSKKTMQIDKNGIVIAIYESAKEAARMTGLDHAHIVDCCNGKKRKTVGGYAWRYEGGNDLSQFQC